MIRAFLAALRFEGVTLLRTRETHTFGLIPGLVGFPVLVFATVGIVLLRPEPVVAVPPGFSLAAGDGLVAREVADPLAAFAAGEVDLAIASAEGADDGTWRVEARWRDEAGRAALATAVNRGARERLDERVVAAGGAVGHHRKVARTGAGSRSEPAPDLARPLAMIFTVAAVYLSCYLVPVRGASERAGGVLEALAVTPTPPWVVGAARLLVVTAFGLSVPSLAGLSMLVMVGPTLPVPPPASLVEVAATTLFANAVFLAIGATADSSRHAFGWANSAMLVGMGGFAEAFFRPVPWVPVLGFGAGDEVALGVRLAALALCLVGVGAGTARLLRRDGAVLPPSGGSA